MKKSMFLSIAVGVLLAGCGGSTGTAKGPPSNTKGTVSCSEQNALRMVENLQSGSSIPKSGFRLVGGSKTDGWLFQHKLGFDNYVGPNCSPWFPLTVGAITQRIQSAQYVHHHFHLVGVGDGSDASSATTIPPYEMTVNPAAGLEVIDYSRAPLANNPGAIVLPLYPNAPPVHIQSVSAHATAKGFQLVLSVSLPQPPERSTFSLTGLMLRRSNGTHSSTYQLVLEGVQGGHLSAPKSFPWQITMREGLPSKTYPSIYSAGDWRSVPTNMRYTPGDNAYTIDIHGVSSRWNLSTQTVANQITLTFTKG